MKQSKGYMVSPLDLTERQLLIYRVLYTRSNFDTMLVNITIDQVISEIKIIDLTYKVVYNEIKKLQQFGYIELVKKATKGNAPIYKIINYSEIIGKPKVNQRETKGKPKCSNSNSLTDIEVNQRETKGKPKGYTIKEKEKEKENNIRSFDHDQLNHLWKMYPIKKGKQIAFNKMPNLIKVYGYEQIERCITRYVKEIEINKIEKQFIKYGSSFFNNGYEDYLDENYESNIVLEDQFDDKPKGKVIPLSVFGLEEDIVNE